MAVNEVKVTTGEMLVPHKYVRQVDRHAETAIFSKRENLFEQKNRGKKQLFDRSFITNNEFSLPNLQLTFV